MNQVGAIQKSFGTISALFHLANELLLIGYFYFTKMAKEIQLTQGKVAIVDDDMYDYLNQWKWYANEINGKFYAVRSLRINKKCTCILMHRLITNNNNSKMHTDHCNANTLDNRKENLRICTAQQNNFNRNIGVRNTSGYKGVSWHKVAKKYSVTIEINKIKHYLGLYINIKEAAKIYNDAAIKYHGQFAKLNKID